MTWPGGEAVRDLLGDVEDIVAAVTVAGLSFPDPDLPDEVAGLAARAREMGLDGGAEHLDALGVALVALAGASDRDARLERSRRALDRLHLLVAWTRMFRAELDLLVVQAGLGRSDAPAEVPALTRRVRPVGFDLRGERLTLTCLDEVDGAPVVLLDLLAELDPLDPLGRHVISRLFQDRVDLREVLESVVELIDHPVSSHGGQRVFAPAFATRPRLRRPGRGGPVLRSLVTGGVGGLDPAQSGPGAVSLRVVARGDRVAVRTEPGVPVGLHPTPVLRTVLTKLLIREGTDDAGLRAVLQHREDRWVLLAADDPVEGRCYPAWDPSAFGLAPTVIARRAPDGPKGWWLRAAAGLFGGLGPEERDALGARVAVAEAGSVGEALRLGFMARALAVERPVDLERLRAAALSEDERDVLAALWLADAGNVLDALPLQLLLERRLAPVDEGDLPAIAVRTVLRAHADPDGFADAALPFLEAHLHALQRALRSPDAPLPDLFDLVLLGDVLAWIRGADRLGPIVLPLGLARDRLWRAVVAALHTWSRGGSADGAGDALLLTAAAGLAPWILTR